MTDGALVLLQNYNNSVEETRSPTFAAAKPVIHSTRPTVRPVPQTGETGWAGDASGSIVRRGCGVRSSCRGACPYVRTIASAAVRSSSSGRIVGSNP